MIQEVLAVDLDGTLLHPEPEAIAVWGRTRYQYLSQTAANKLAEISQVLPVVIATARHAQTVKSLVDQLPITHFFGFVLENGLVVKKNLNQPSVVNYSFETIAQLLPEWSRIEGYENCLGLIPPSSIENPKEEVEQIISNLQIQAYVYLDGHKLFVYPAMPSKLAGLRALDCFPILAMGNDWNDLDMLRASSCPLTVSNAHVKVQALINDNRGYCSPLVSHAAAEDILKQAIFRLNNSEKCLRL